MTVKELIELLEGQDPESLVSLEIQLFGGNYIHGFLNDVWSTGDLTVIGGKG
jgi:hypothetical protein